MLPNHYILSAKKIALKDRVVSGYGVEVLGEKIVSVDRLEKLSKKIPHFTLSDNETLLPGFIDLHIHGSQGFDVMDQKKESLEAISQSLLNQGVCGFLATTMTAAKENIEKTLKVIGETKSNSDKVDNLLGVHLEGPFINEKYMGAQNAKFIQKPQVELFKSWQKLSGNLIKQLTIAPEVDGALDLIEALKDENMILSAGHCAATCKIAQNSFEKGISHVTHLYNAMSGVHHREPGLATAVLLDEKVSAELIVDRIHLSDEIISLTVKVLGKDRIILITDAMCAQGLGEGEFSLGGQKVLVKNNQARLLNGTLAGSVLSMNMAIKNMIKASGVSFEDAILMASLNPAKKLKLSDQYGSIEAKKYANFTVMNENFEIKKTFIKGRGSL